MFSLVVLQFIRPARNDGQHNTVHSFVRVYDPPDSIRHLLQNSCYDCHSNKTNYPWYTNLQPVGWFMARHIKEGKETLNFDEFGSYSARRQKSKLKAIYSQVQEDKMPLESYARMHKNARFTAMQKATLLGWIQTLSDSLHNN